MHLHFWATSPLADARECATAAKGNLPRNSSAQAQPHKSEKLHCGVRLQGFYVPRMYVYTCIRSIVLYMFDLSAALGACCLLRTGSGYQHHYIPTHLDFTNGAHECVQSWEGTASLYRQWHCTFSQYDQTNIAKYLSVPWTTTTNPCCPLPREACALEACPHLAWRTLATAWQQLPLSWPSPMLPHLSPHIVRNNQFFFFNKIRPDRRLRVFRCCSSVTKKKCSF